MNTLDTIYSRKSVRSYTGESISEEELDIILKAANAAPVGLAKYENMHLTVISNADLLKKIEANAAQAMGNPDLHVCYGAPMFILVSTREPAPTGQNIAYSNAAIIAHNMALVATELGIGTCHIWGAIGTLAANPELVKEFNLPEGFIPCCGVVLGKTDAEYEVREIPDRITKNVIK